ncbi:MAG TPA: 1-acyl-sn-glycerol-3-phosphate acyltransferase [Thermoanaerobaculia bacterium]|nr:1-acyl-sn-glycerol-3-phosphate acyltransferase [Thermoanaerobaculia bacterium]
MSRTVALPLWLVAVLVVLAVWAVLERLLIPSVRWFLRRRVNRVLEEIHTRLKIAIPEFKLTRRDVLIDRLLYDPQVQEAAEAFAREQDMPREVAMAKVAGYAREIVPSFNAYAYFRIGYALARGVARTLFRVRLGYSDEEGLAAIPPRSTVVFLINHRSNMDYILVGYLAAEKAAISYAVGEWARIWPLQTLVRAMGAYFVRRNSRDALYRKVLERWVAMATEAGVTQAVFPEGGLSRDGKLRPPKVGILDYMLRAFDPQGERDIAFIPVGINYDRTFEDRSLLSERDSSAPRPGALAAAANAMRFVVKNLLLMARNRWHRFGYACVNFGPPISLKRYATEHGLDARRLEREERFARVTELAEHLMGAIARVIPVVPVSLVARTFVSSPQRAWSELEIKAAVLETMRDLEARGAHVYVPRGDQDYAVDVGLRMLTLRRLVVERDGLFTPAAAEMPLLEYYANSIAHLFERDEKARSFSGES